MVVSMASTSMMMRCARSRQPLRIECAHKKGAGSTKNGRDSNSKRLGVKVYGGQHVTPGGIIVRQRGTKVSRKTPPGSPPSRRDTDGPSLRPDGTHSASLARGFPFSLPVPSRPVPSVHPDRRRHSDRHRLLFPLPLQFYPGDNVGMGNDYTLYAKCEGVVAFEYKAKRDRQYVVVKELPEM